MQNELFEKIELYLHNQLEGEELRRFEEQLKNDEELQQQVLLYKTIDSEMRQKTAGSDEEEKLKKTLSDLHRKYFNRDDTTKVVAIQKRRRWLFAAAAVLLLLIAGAYWYFFADTTKDNETLYTQYAVYEPLSSQRGSKDSSLMLQNAIAAYNNKQFNEALTSLTAHLHTDSSDAELMLAKSICLTETGHYEEAIAGFDRLAEKNEIFKYQALWYKALAYLKQNDKAGCKQLLESIPPGADTYGKAKQLLRDL